MTLRRILFASVVGTLLAACDSPAPEPEPRRSPEPAPKATAQLVSGHANGDPGSKQPARPVKPPERKVSAKPVAEVPVSPDDPVKGKFTLADATKGLPGKGPLEATIATSMGKLSCELYEDKAPITVANFVGLARGKRPFKTPEGKWVKKPAYDGTTFHRVIKGFMIQGGDPAGTGAGEPGYVIPDEIWEDAHHDERGQLCMANRGPNTNGMQFFIMDGVAKHLDGGYTIFGKCQPEDVIEKLASTSVRGDRAIDPPKIEKITIKRGKPAAAGKTDAKL
ncbi:MAG: peptidylprolyl isomerase [Myxococcales bacterium]|nr:peptidylprolyl isomerase [Myxococcales bacterium]MCB9576446.1 peptidylprolyl isomerase [Polyangiaceae bacterium]